MVTISKGSSSQKATRLNSFLNLLAYGATITILFLLIVSFPEFFADEETSSDRQPQPSNPAETVSLSVTGASKLQNVDQKSSSATHSCPFMKLSDLNDSERHPQASASRHIVDPPADTRIDLVCCTTTAGPWSIAVHHSWAPLGAARFMEMVRAEHFSSPKVPLMRCIRNFLCQFGLNGPSVRRFKAFPDDPQWLPNGPDHRVNALGVKRFQRGYLSYAGGGANTRSNQLFVALADNAFLGGGSPWEVPWGELVGSHSYDTLDKIYTGYGEKGPGQGMLHQDNAIEITERDFPEISWILGCSVVDSVQL